MSTNEYLFPFALVPRGKKILLYGAGKVGRVYAKQLLKSNYAELVGFVDRYASSYNKMIVPVYSPKEVSAVKFDFIIISMKNESAQREVLHVLEGYGVEKEKIIFAQENEKDSIILFQDDETDSDSNSLSCYQSRHSVAIHTTGGLGDKVIHKCFVDALIKMIPDCRIDIYTDTEMNFSKIIYKSCSNIALFKYDMGINYKNNFKKYSLSLTICDSHCVKIDFFDENQWLDFSEFVNTIHLLKERIKMEPDTGVLHSALFRSIYSGKNCYTVFDYAGLMGIDEQDSHILYTENEHKKQELGLPDLYVTVNYGNGTNTNEKFIAKAWPLENFNHLVDLLKKIYPNIAIVQLGNESAIPIRDVDFYFFGENFESVMCILKHSLLHIDIEGGLVHLATQLGTKCAVLFGPTPVQYYGYPKNINILVGECHDCYGLYDNINLCAKHLTSPICMHRITPQIVLKHIQSYLDIAIKKKTKD